MEHMGHNFARGDLLHLGLPLLLFGFCCDALEVHGAL